MAGRIQKNRSNLDSNHLSLPEQDAQDLHTIYKLKLSMKKRLSPQSMETPSPEGSGELKNMLQRLVEIDTESRDLLIKVFSMLEKDEKLENYFNKRVKDPKVSKMWELVEQVLACQEHFPNLNYDGLVSDNSLYDKGIEERDQVEQEFKLTWFKVKTLDTSAGADEGGKGLELGKK